MIYLIRLKQEKHPKCREVAEDILLDDSTPDPHPVVFEGINVVVQLNWSGDPTQSRVRFFYKNNSSHLPDPHIDVHVWSWGSICCITPRTHSF